MENNATCMTRLYELIVAHGHAMPIDPTRPRNGLAVHIGVLQFKDAGISVPISGESPPTLKSR